MEDGLINFNQYEETVPIIKVIGVGGGGGNAVEYMCEQGIRDVDFVLCNTDKQVVEHSKVPTKIQLGKKQTQGLGAGNRPEWGEAAAIESEEEIREVLSKNTKMVFITAAMGGGTGTGAAPVIARLAKEMGILTVGIVTVPAQFEGPKRLGNAKKGVLQLKEYVDALIIINNEKIQQIYENLTISAAFAKANDVLNIAAKGIAEIITLPGYINVDFADVKTVMTDSGIAIMGAAQASGEGRARRVIEEALNSPLLNKSDILGAKNILLNITSGTDEITMDEMTEITNYVIKEVGDSAAIIWGVGEEENLGEAISVTIIATGFPMEDVEHFLSPVKKISTQGFTTTTATEEQQKEIGKGVREYVGQKLKETDIALRPGLSDEEIEELRTVPAYERRNIKIDRI